MWAPPSPNAMLPSSRASLVQKPTTAPCAAESIVDGGEGVVAASIVNAFVNLLDEREQREAVLAAWRGFEIEQRRQFPELVPSQHE
ncbi:hypothetical protein B0H11DRAFT_2272175 [Mycena galericulata]|nr:hypothetical protein B0H11DRAFT_2272175 [Mycena galericulata]